MQLIGFDLSTLPLISYRMDGDVSDTWCHRCNICYQNTTPFMAAHFPSPDDLCFVMANTIMASVKLVRTSIVLVRETLPTSTQGSSTQSEVCGTSIYCLVNHVDPWKCVGHVDRVALLPPISFVTDHQPSSLATCIRVQIYTNTFINYICMSVYNCYWYVEIMENVYVCVLVYWVWSFNNLSTPLYNILHWCVVVCVCDTLLMGLSFNSKCTLNSLLDSPRSFKLLTGNNKMKAYSFLCIER